MQTGISFPKNILYTGIESKVSCGSRFLNFYYGFVWLLYSLLN